MHRRQNFVLSYCCHFGYSLIYFVVCLEIHSVTSYKSAAHCNKTTSVQNYRLTDHVLLERRAESIFECIKACDEHGTCRSVNYKLSGLVCQLNKADAHTAPHSYIPAKGYVYGDNPWLKIKVNSCADIKQIVPDAKSGYYKIYNKGEEKKVFCDMVNYGGGWTLVVSISSSNNNHLDRGVVNCLHPDLCVEYVTTDIPTRKLSDEEIHEIATTEGTFRVDQITGGYTAFFQIPYGAHAFNSECLGQRCPRIIVSHVYPYQWESNCKGTELGYRIYSHDCYRVFDMHDNLECGGMAWQSTKYSTNRILYGLPCSSFGIYHANQGLVFVK